MNFKYPVLLRAFQVVFFPFMFIIACLDLLLGWLFHVPYWIFTGHFDYLAFTSFLAKNIYNHEFDGDDYPG